MPTQACRSDPCTKWHRNSEVQTALANLRDLPNNDGAFFEAAHACLAMLNHGYFPTSAVIAHHWMIGGSFSRSDGPGTRPRDCISRYPPNQACDDFLTGIAHMLAALKMSSPPAIAMDPPLISLELPYDINIRTAICAFPHIANFVLGQGTNTLLKGTILFWESDIMRSCNSTACCSIRSRVMSWFRTWSPTPHALRAAWPSTLT